MKNVLKSRMVYTILIFSSLLYVISLYEFKAFYLIVEIFALSIAVGVFLIAYNISTKQKNNYLYILAISIFIAAILDILHLANHIEIIPEASPVYGRQLYFFGLITLPFGLLVSGIFAYKKISFKYMIINVFFILYLFIILYLVFELNYFESSTINPHELTPFIMITFGLVVISVLLFVIFFVTKISEDSLIKNSLIHASILLLFYYVISFSTIQVEDFLGKIALLTKAIAYVFIYRALVHRSILLILENTEQLQTSLQNKNKELIQLSMYDTLTNIYNRYSLQKQLNQLEEDHVTDVALLLGDVNGLKLTNDVFGHDTGDKLLVEIANILGKLKSPDIIVGRWSGDEFLIIMKHANNKKISNILEKISTLCNESTAIGFNPDITFGYAIRSHNSQSFDDIMAQAEDMMYSKKLIEGRTQKTDILKSLEVTLYEKSSETEEHTSRIAEKATEIGKSMNLSEHDILQIALVSRMHDIGKVAIRDSILKKPGPLNKYEWLEMKRHPEIGYRIAQTDPMLTTVADYILTHHENYDGSGYPQNLKKEEIPLISRIIRVVDSYDAMTNDRVYRKALSHNEAIQELIKYKNIYYDPNIVDLFITLFGKEEIVV